MAFSVDIPSNLPTKDYIVAFGHMKLIRSKSNNGKSKKVPIEIRRKSTSSKFPKNINYNMYKKKNQDSDDQSHTLGDTAGTSKQTNSKIGLENSDKEKCNRSLISQRKSNLRETPSRETSASSMKSESNEFQASSQQRNVQRVQLLNINPDFCQEVNSPPKSVASTRPIPTLGQIYQQGPNDNTSTFADWYLASVGDYSNSFENSVETTSTSTDYTVNTCIGVGNSENNQQIDDISTTNINNVSLLTNTSPRSKIFKTTNENVSEWLSAELDHPTRDNESETGYHPITPPSKIPVAMCNNPVSSSYKMLYGKNTIRQDFVKKSNLSNEVAKSGEAYENSHFFLNNQPTIIIKKIEESINSEPVFLIPKTNTDIKEKDFYPDFHKPMMFHSTPVVPKRRETINKNRTASYVEYPSEILQKTTNFESDGGDNLSSIVETDHGLSSSWMFNRNTDSSTLSGLTWSKLQISQETLRESFKNSKSWKSDGFDEKHGILDSEKYSYHDYYHHYCWRKEVAKKEINERTLRDYRGRCNKCHKCRRSPKKKGPFRYLRKRMTMGICRHRLNRVWKKTAAKWANWSKSASKFRRLGVMNYLQKSIIWDNANVQTTIFVYHETGTDAVAKEQKSAEITASIKLNTCSSYKYDAWLAPDKGVTSPNKHDDVGPSIFPFLRYSSNNTVQFRGYQSKPSSRDVLAGGVKEIRSVNTQCSYTFEEDITTLAQNVKIKRAVSQDAYTQVLITCNNVDTNIAFKPPNQNKSPFSSQDLLYNGVDAATDPVPPDQRSMNVMTSSSVLQSLTHNETQVSPSESIWNVSTGILVQNMYRDAKSSVVTDTSVPRRHLDATLITTNGKVLTCTGTKITSVSSADIHSASIISRASRPYTITAAFSRVANKDCSTASSLYRRDVEDVSLETETVKAKTSEKSTSNMKIADLLDIGLSASSVVKRASIDCGSHLTRCSFGAAIRPEYTSAVVTTEMDSTSKIIDKPKLEHSSCVCKIKRDCYTQCSSFIRNGSLNGGCQIGRSRLISVRALLPDAIDGSTQAQPSRCSAETKTSSNHKMSASVLTSQLALEQRFHTLEATFDRERTSASNEAPVRSNDIAKTSNDVTESVVAPVSKKSSKRSNPSVCNKTNSRMNSKPSIIGTSSNLDAGKWIKESVKENKDIDSIVKISENAVSESLQRAALLASSGHKLGSNVIHELSQVLLNPDINCVTSKPYEVSSNSPTKTEWNNENKLTVETRTKSRHTLTIDKMTSDEVVIKDVRASILQVQTNVCDTATDSPFENKSAGVLTSRHVLPRSTLCGANGGSHRECLFVYDRPRCVIHANSVDVAVQIQTQAEKNRKKKLSSQHSIAIEALLPCQMCSHRRSKMIGEALTPREYKSLYEATKLVTKEGYDSRSSKVSSNTSSFDKTVDTEDANKVTSQMTSCLGHLPAQCCCMRCTHLGPTGHTDTRSIQAVKDSFLFCPKCKTKIDVSEDDPECFEDCARSDLATSCRYYSNLLTVKLGRVRDNFIKHLAPSVVESIYSLTGPEVYAEVCTMKPSGKLDEDCQAKIPEINNLNNIMDSSCLLTPAFSAMDLRGHDKNDLRTVYYILSGIEGRVRRLKNKLQK